MPGTQYPYRVPETEVCLLNEQQKLIKYMPYPVYGNHRPSVEIYGISSVEKSYQMEVGKRYPNFIPVRVTDSRDGNRYNFHFAVQLIPVI